MMALAWLDRHELLLGQQLARLESQESKLANPLLLSINKEQETTFLQLPLSQVKIDTRFTAYNLTNLYTSPSDPDDCLLTADIAFALEPLKPALSRPIIC